MRIENFCKCDLRFLFWPNVSASPRLSLGGGFAFAQHQLIMACRSVLSEGEMEDVDWSDVVKVEIHCQVPPKCARCYQRPFLPRIGKCGHIYCFPCIWIRIAFEHDERTETCPACGRSLKMADLKRWGKNLVSLHVPLRVSTFQSYVPKVGDKARFHLMNRDKKVVNSYVVDIWTENYHSHLVRAKRRNFLHLIRKDIASMKRYFAEREKAGSQCVTTMVARELLCVLRQQLDRFYKDRSDKSGRFAQKYYLRMTDFY